MKSPAEKLGKKRLLLAGEIAYDDLHKLKRYPKMVLPKLDGIRCVREYGTANYKSGKPIENTFLREWAIKHIPEGVECEIVIPGQNNFQAVSSMVRQRDSVPEQFCFYVFDVNDSFDYIHRYMALQEVADDKHIQFIAGCVVHGEGELKRTVDEYFNQAYEGAIIRRLDAPYFRGQSTLVDEICLKCLRLATGEGVVIEVLQMMAQDEVTPLPYMGALRVKDCKTGEVHKVGTGFKEAERLLYWQQPGLIMGQTIRHYSKATGVKDAPRCPVFDGIVSEGTL